MSEIERLSKEAGVRVANVFHAGDGNLHHSYYMIAASRGRKRPPKRFHLQILELCIAAGGSITANMAWAKTKRK